jgi:hypothetical protein
MEAGSAGAVDQDVEPAELGNRFLGDFLRACEGARVAGDEDRALRSFSVGIARSDDDLCATVKQALCCGRADAPRTSGNQDALAGKLSREV